MVGPKGIAVALMLASVACLPLRAGEEPTFYGHIATIIHTHCADCHRPGGAAPFALLSQHDITSRADDILRVVKSGEMPPWKAVGKQGEFLGDRRLTEAQKR